MSTITLSMEQLYRPVPSTAAGSSAITKTTNSSAAKNQGSVPKFRSSGYHSGTVSISTPELVSRKRDTTNNKELLDNFQTQDDSMSQVSWARAGLGSGRKSVAEVVDISSIHMVDLPPSIRVAAIVPVISRASTPDRSTTDAIEKIPIVSEISSSTPTKIQSQAPQTPQTPQRSTAPPLRKLKSLLKLPQLTKSQSMSVLSPKSVRFASTLEKVKMFDGKDSPRTVSHQGSPLNSSKYEFAMDDYFSIRPECEDLSDDESDSSSSQDNHAQSTNEKQYKITSSNFDSPHNIYDKCQSPVYLQSASFSADKKSLVLLVMCQNLAFEKRISIKLTYNEWKSQMIYNSAIYCKSFSSVNFDQFKFTIPLVHLPPKVSTEFCIQYDVNGSTYWDNNNTKNYRFKLEQFKKPSVSKNMFNFRSQKMTDSFTYRPPNFSPQSPIGTSALESELLVSHSTPKSSSSASHYNELVNKLMSVKRNDERPRVTSSPKLSTKPRYSQSYLSKKGTDSTETLSPTARKSPMSTSSSNESTLKLSSGYHTPLGKRTTAPDTTDASCGSSRPLLQHSPMSAPNSSSVNFKAMSYADLLSNYCFNGVDRKSTFSNPQDSFSSSCNNSSTSLSSDYMSPTSTFHSMNDSFYV